MTTQLTGIQAVERVRDNLEAAGLPRKSKLSGGEITGWTTVLGSTGFSIRENSPNVTWHLVISGFKHFEYREYRTASDDTDRHKPVNPDAFNDRIAKVFKDMGLTVHDTLCTGHSTLWDDDVHYEVTTNQPEWLSAQNEAL